MTHPALSEGSFPQDNGVSEGESQRLLPARTASEPIVSYHLVSDFPGWDKAPDWILNIIRSQCSKAVLEVGSGANPTLSADVVSALNIRYTANDISSGELDKADSVFDRWVGDLATDEVPETMKGRFDLVFSRMVNEHISDGEAYHRRIFQLLRPGGVAAHCFSTLYSLPFLTNKFAPAALSEFLLGLFRPRDPHKLGKFRAYYSWSRGPSALALSRIESLGYQVLEYRGYFGHTAYLRVRPLHFLEGLKSRFLLDRPMPFLCSYAVLIARKP